MHNNTIQIEHIEAQQHHIETNTQIVSNASKDIQHQSDVENIRKEKNKIIRKIIIQLF